MPTYKKLRNRLLIVLSLTAYDVAAQQTIPSMYTGPVSYVRTWDPVIPEQNSNNITVAATPDKFRMTTLYLDGLGRPIQTVMKKGSLVTNPYDPILSSDAVDLVTSTLYDELGREKYKYLPFGANNTNGNLYINDGFFKANSLNQQAAFYSDANGPVGGQGETWYYGQTNYEPSPLNRIQEVFAPGNSWVGTSGNPNEADRNSVKIKYYLNTLADQVRIWNVTDVANDWGTYATAAGSGGYYPAGTLYKTITVDEQDKQVIEFKDKNGKLILKKVQLTGAADDGTGRDHTDWLCTYYIYDNLFNLRCVIQPEGVKTLLPTWSTSVSLTADLLNEQCFRYEYDKRNRMIRKKVPGAGEVWMVYDARDRLVMTQDANMRRPTQREWLYTVYDNFNRPVATGLLTDNTGNYNNLTYHLAAADASSSYPNTGLYTTVELTRTFYDDYNWRSSWGNPLSGAYNTSYDTHFEPVSNSWPYAQANIQATQVRGLVTGTRVRVLGTGTYLFTATFYDEKSRIIQVQSQNVSGGTDIATTQYTWAGQPYVVVNKTENAGSPQTNEVVTRATYDHLGRIVKTEKKLKNTLVDANVMSAYKAISEVSYDGLGQIINKKLAPAYNSNAGLETLSYDYNIRNWLLGINRQYLANSASGGNWFGFELGYDKISNKTGVDFTTPQYNGNINGMIWKSDGNAMRRRYDFTYDAANRLLQGTFKQNDGGGSTWNDNIMNYTVKMGNGSNPDLAYDHNGNIKSMTQYGWKLGASPASPIDQLDYTYFANNGIGSNKLQKVTDAVTVDNGLGDFTDKNTTATDYGYDLNGNMITDLNKRMNGNTGIDQASGGAITYNHLNLPQEVRVKDDLGNDKGIITYTYDATGNKLKKVTVENSTTVSYDGINYATSVTTTTTYIAGTVYESKAYNHASLGPIQYTDQLQFISHEEGRIRFVKANPATCTASVNRFMYDYFLKDHLGNIRSVLTEQNEDVCYITASVEDATWQKENKVYTIVDSRRVSKVDAGNPSQTSFGNKLYRVDGDAGNEKTGLGIVLKVMKGDVVKISAESYYTMPGGGPGGISTLGLTELLTAFATSGSVSTSHGGVTTSGVSGAGSNTSLLNNFITTNNPGSNTARSFLNWILFDDQLKVVTDINGNIVADVDPVNQNGGYKLHDHFITNPVQVPKSGYLYIYVSNENNMPVYFDNLAVTHTPGPLMEETHYYPFGLTMAGISSKALAFGNPQNRFKFNSGNELQSGEFSDNSGLELFDAVNRLYDPQIGRFWQIDELAEANWEESPYSFAHNNPILYNDPLGLEPETSTADKPKELQEVIVVSIPRSRWGKQRLYYEVRDYLNSKGATIDQIMQPSLREMMYRFDHIVKFGNRVADKTEAADKAFLEFASLFLPTGWLTKLKYAKYAAKLFNWKRGKIVRSVGADINRTEDVLQTGGHTLKKSTLKALDITKEQGKTAIEGLKKELGLPSNFHGKILGNGDVVNPHTKDVLGNLFDYL